jgi:hypothetical protein
MRRIEPLDGRRQGARRTRPGNQTACNREPVRGEGLGHRPRGLTGSNELNRGLGRNRIESAAGNRGIEQYGGINRTYGGFEDGLSVAPQPGKVRDQ